MTAKSEFLRSTRSEPGPRDRILDIFGSFVRDFGRWIAVADLLALLGSMGVGEASGRSALSRMKRQGELVAVSRGPVRGYTLTGPAEEWFEDGTTRIMSGPPSGPDDLWVLASFTVPEDARNVRYRIRTRLQDLGFGQLSGGLMIAPASILDETVRALDRADLIKYIDLWQSRHVGSVPMTDIVASAWDLPMLDDAYRSYLELAGELEGSPPPADDEESFVRYLTHMNAWRELPFMDPAIPASYLPSDWPAAQARATFSRISDVLRPGAWRHFVRVATAPEGHDG